MAQTLRPIAMDAKLVVLPPAVSRGVVREFSLGHVGAGDTHVAIWGVSAQGRMTDRDVIVAESRADFVLTMTLMRAVYPSVEHAALPADFDDVFAPSTDDADKGDSDDSGGPSDLELDITCDNNWYLYYEEDEDGNPIMGTIGINCDGTEIPVG